MSEAFDLMKGIIKERQINSEEFKLGKRQGALEEQLKRGELLRDYEIWLFNNGLLSKIEDWWSECYLKEKGGLK